MSFKCVYSVLNLKDDQSHTPFLIFNQTNMTKQFVTEHDEINCVNSKPCFDCEYPTAINVNELKARRNHDLPTCPRCSSTNAERQPDGVHVCRYCGYIENTDTTTDVVGEP